MCVRVFSYPLLLNLGGLGVLCQIRFDAHMRRVNFVLYVTGKYYHFGYNFDFCISFVRV